MIRHPELFLSEPHLSGDKLPFTLTFTPTDNSELPVRLMDMSLGCAGTCADKEATSKLSPNRHPTTSLLWGNLLHFLKVPQCSGAVCSDGLETFPSQFWWQFCVLTAVEGLLKVTAQPSNRSVPPTPTPPLPPYCPFVPLPPNSHQTAELPPTFAGQRWDQFTFIRAPRTPSPRKGRRRRGQLLHQPQPTAQRTSQ